MNESECMALKMPSINLDCYHRVSRALNLHHGNILLMGFGGSGRRSAIKLAASMIDADLFEIDANRDYDSEQWRQDLRKMLMNVGIQGKFTVFLFSDIQMIEDDFLDDISILLTAGDLPNLYPADEKSVILEAMHNLAKQEVFMRSICAIFNHHHLMFIKYSQDLKIDMTPLSLYSLFIGRVRQCLRFALIISPLSETYRKCFIIYPSLNSFCTMDWFSEWPDDALEHVAKKFIVSMNLSNSGVVDKHLEASGDLKSTTDITATAEESDDDANADMSQLEKNLVEIVLYFNHTMREASERY